MITELLQVAQQSIGNDQMPTVDIRQYDVHGHAQNISSIKSKSNPLFISYLQIHIFFTKISKHLSSSSKEVFV